MENGACEKTGQNAVIENIMSRRSVRNYKPQAVPRDVLKTIMECGINAPNGQNKQSWEVRVVDKPELQGEIKAAMAAAGGERAAGCFYNAPVWVFIASDKAYDFSTIDCGLLSENIMLAANALGVGSVCLGSPVRFIMESPQRDAVMPKLGFSEGYELCICIALGYPDEAPAAKPRDFNKVKFVD
jgi:nitroreductase